MGGLRKYWFLIGLLALIPLGLCVGVFAGDSEFTQRWTGIAKPRVVTTVVLFLMAFTLDSRQIAGALRAPGPVMFASAINLGLIPLLALLLAPRQLTEDFRYGLMIAATVPCTLAAASVWTRKAKGDDAVSLLVTLTTNSLCVVVTPFWLSLAISQSTRIDLSSIALGLIYAVLVPTAAGQVARLIPACGRWATTYKIPLGVVAQMLILSLVFTAAITAGGKLAAPGSAGGPRALLLVSACCIGLHLTGMLVAWVGGGLFGFPLPRRIATVFAGSQKTLPIGVLLATDPAMFGNAGVPFALFPMIIYHTSQLLIDTSVAQALARRADRENEQQNGANGNDEFPVAT